MQLTANTHDICVGVQHRAQGRLVALQASQSPPQALIGYSVRALPRKQFIGRVDKVWHTPIAMHTLRRKTGLVSA